MITFKSYSEHAEPIIGKLEILTIEQKITICFDIIIWKIFLNFRRLFLQLIMKSMITIQEMHLNSTNLGKHTVTHKGVVA